MDFSIRRNNDSAEKSEVSDFGTIIMIKRLVINWRSENNMAVSMNHCTVVWVGQVYEKSSCTQLGGAAYSSGSNSTKGKKKKNQ